MINVDLSDFIKQSIINNSILKLKWFIDMFNFIKENSYEDEFIKIENKKYFIKLEDELILITDKYTDALLNFNDKITINSEIKVNVKQSTDTTIGRLLINYLIGTYCFNNKIEYLNRQFNYSDIEALIEPIFDDKDNITVKEYKTFLNMKNYIDGLANFATLGITEHSLLPAPGIEEYKKKVIKELIEEYGEEELNNNPVVFKKLEDKLLEYDKNYLKKDPAYGKMITKKILNTSRKILYGVHGIGLNLKGKSKPVFSSLSEGMKKDREELSAYFNDLRGGSFGRGDETKDAGFMTKFLIRATADIVINKEDCGTKLYLSETITSDNEKEFINKYIIDKDKLVLLDKNIVKSYINKTVKLRDSMFCKSETGVCIYCIGRNYEDFTDNIPLLATSLGGAFLNAKLKKFHSSELKVTQLDEKVFV